MQCCLCCVNCARGWKGRNSMANAAVPLLITGATGRMGGLLRRLWPAVLPGGLQPVWQARRAVPGSVGWDLLREPCPAGLASGVVLGLAGVIAGDTGLNRDLGLATCRAAVDQGARQVFLASSAAVYGGSEVDLAEDAACAPLGDYGRSKLAMEAAAQEFAAGAGVRLTLLRIGNVAGLDALLGGNAGTVVLDPVAGSDAGPVRSYIGPVSLGFVLERLAGLALEGAVLPPVLNIAAPLPVSMAGLLEAAGRDWRFGPVRKGVVPRVVLETGLLQRLVPLPPEASLPGEMVAQWRRVQA